MPDIEETAPPDPNLAHATAIVSAYVANNAVPASDLPALFCRTYEAIRNISMPPVPAESASPAPERLVPAVPIDQSIADNYLVCLEDGLKFKSLKRHLRTQYNLSPNEYREKWGLSWTYPMVAPAYAKTRSALAKQMGLGAQRKQQLAARTAAAPKPTKPATKKPAAKAAA